MFLLLTVAAVVLTTASYGFTVEDAPVVTITSLTSNIIGLNNDFKFSCVVNSANFSITAVRTIDGHNRTDGINKKVINDGLGYNYTYQDVIPADNSTVFFCNATDGNDTVVSDNIILQVTAAPIFTNSSNDSQYAFIATGDTTTINCSVSYANPPITRLSISNDSTANSTSNVKFDNTTGVLTFTKAEVSNRGNYTCMATNDMGSTTLNYETFIGGPPDNISIIAYLMIKNDSFVFSFNVTDNSHAPATSIIISIFEIYEIRIAFDDYGLHIPVQHYFNNTIELDLNGVVAGDYQFMVAAGNDLGNQTVITEPIFLNGTYPLNVSLVPALMNVTEGGNYTFECQADPPDNVNIIFNVMIDNEDEDKHPRLIRGSNTSHSQQFTLINTVYTDDGTVFACIVNTLYYSNETVLTVFYSPVLSVPSELGGFLGQPLIVNITVTANPINYTTQWFIDGNVLIPANNIHINGSVIMFDNLTDTDISNYTLWVKNGIGNGTNATFALNAYDGPYFNEGESNSTILTEKKSGSDFNLTCSVKSSKPAVKELSIMPENGSNWHTIKDGVNKATIVFTDGTATNNTRQFTCIAKNGVTVSTLTFDNYVGGAPDGVVVNITHNDNDQSIVFSAKVTDNSSVPATSIIFNLKDYKTDNITKTISHPPLNGSSESFNDIIKASYEELGVGTTHILKVYAGNVIGTSLVKSYSFTVPNTQHHKKSKAGVIAAGILVPLAIIAFILIGIAAFIYYRRNLSREGFTRLAGSDNDGNVGGSGYRTDKIIT